MRKGKKSKNKSAGQKRTVRGTAPRGTEGPKVRTEHQSLLDAAVAAQSKHRRLVEQLERSLRELRGIRRALAQTMRDAEHFIDYSLDPRC